MKTHFQIALTQMVTFLLTCTAAHHKTTNQTNQSKSQMNLIQKKLKNGIIQVESGDGKSLETAYLMSGTNDLTEATVASFLILTSEYGDYMKTWTVDSLQLKKIDNKDIGIVVLKNGVRHYFDFSLILRNDLKNDN